MFKESEMNQHGHGVAVGPDGHIVVTFCVFKTNDESEYTATCQELRISSQGETVEKALDRVCEAAVLYLNVLEQEGERQRVFEELGIQVSTGDVADVDSVRVPLDVIISRRSIPLPTPAVA
jgi:predicted RNase H-like HicB family nuclease